MSGAWVRDLAVEMLAEAGAEQGLPPVVQDTSVIERLCALVKAGGR